MFKPVILNFERIHLENEKPSSFLDNDTWCEETESNLDEAPVDKELFTKIMKKMRYNI